MKDSYDPYGEELRGVARLAAQAAQQNWHRPKSGQLAVVEFESWVKEHSNEEVRGLIAHVKEFVEAIGGSWEKIGEPPQDAAAQKQYETICLFAMSAWRMRQLQDLQPRFLEATAQLAELQGSEHNVQQAHLLMMKLLHGGDDTRALPETEPPGDAEGAV